MATQLDVRDYNARLFGKGTYGAHHRARFAWLRRRIQALSMQQASVLEVGCYDGGAIPHLPLAIERYVGYDAGWESGMQNDMPLGIDKARHNYEKDHRFTFHVSANPQDVLTAPGSFDIGLCLETLEHIKPSLINAYLAAFAAKITGHLFITVPNEKGCALLIKTLGAKILRINRNYSYTPGEFINALLGRMERIPRQEHKGFDYVGLVKSLRTHFRSVRVEGVRFPWLPLPLQLTVAIIARP